MQKSDCACEDCTLVFEGKSREMHHLCNGYTNKKKHFDVQALCDFNCDIWWCITLEINGFIDFAQCLLLKK
jgi:hypothetical protein